MPDGDTIRCRHAPNSRLGENAFPEEATGDNRPPWRRKLREETLLLRLCGIDAPETAKFGSKGQPFAEEATEYLRDRCIERVVLIKLLNKDQYGRALVVVIVEDAEKGCCCFSMKIKRDVGEELVHVRREEFWNRERGREDGARAETKTLLGTKTLNTHLYDDLPLRSPMAIHT